MAELLLALVVDVLGAALAALTLAAVRHVAAQLVA